MKASIPKLIAAAIVFMATPSVPASGAIADGLLSYWNFEGNFNDTAGTAVGSTSTTADNGTPANASVATLESGGPLGQYLQLRGSHIVVPNSPDILRGGKSLTISMWFRVNALTAEWQALIAHGEASDYRIARRGNGTVVAYAGGAADIPTGDGIGPAVDDDEWHHVVAISEHEVSMSIWVDGELVATGNPPTLVNNGSPNLNIGANPNAGGRDWNGEIDDVAMWDRPLTDDEIVEIYTMGREGQPLSSQFVINTLPTIGAATSTGDTVSVTFTDSATSQVDVTKTRSMAIDGTPVEPTTITKEGAVTTLSYVLPEPYPPGSEHTVDVRVTTTTDTPVSGTREFLQPFMSNIVGGGLFDTEHVWTRGSPQLGAGNAESVLDDAASYPAEDQWVGKTRYIHFHDDIAPGLHLSESRPYPLWDPVNGGSGFGLRDDFAIRSRGQIFIKEAGTCWFICNSDDGFVLRIDGDEVGSVGDRARGDTVMQVFLEAGAHDIEFIHYERGGGAGVSVYIHKGVSDFPPPVGEDSYELLEAWLNPADTDGDGMPDAYELENDLDPNVNDAAGDKDGDGLTNLEEFLRGTRANNPDTDGDGLNDNVETGTGIWVSATNTGTNPLAADTDGDGLRDGVETNTGTFVSATDTGTNPFMVDTDGDGTGDGAEVTLGTNPLVANPPPSVIATGGTFTTEHVWTRSAVQITGSAAAAEEVLDDPSYPEEDRITAQTRYIHFHDDTPPPWFISTSSPYPLWDPANGGAGFGARDDFALRSRGKILITHPGTIWFNCNSDDGFSLRINGNEIGSVGDRGRGDTLMSVDLEAGEHDLELVHWERAGGAGVSVLVYRAPSEEQPDAVTEDLWQLVEAAPGAPESTLAITSFSYDAATTTLNLSFTSEAGATYALEYTTGFQPAGAPAAAAKWNPVPGYGSIAGAAGTTTIAPLNTSTLVTPGGQLPDNSTCFLRVRRL